MARDLDMLTTISLDTCDTQNSMAATAAAFATVVKDASSLTSFPSEDVSDMMSYAEYSVVKPIELGLYMNYCTVDQNHRLGFSKS